MFNILAIIPARGGSKSIPRKNIRLLGGKPLIFYTIEHAKKSKYISRTIVSTDSNEISDIAKNNGAEVPFQRPKELAEDYIQDFPVCEHALSWFEKNERYVPDIIVWLRPTSPLQKVKHIDEGIKLLMDHPEADSVRSVCLSPKHPLKMWKIENSRLLPFIPAKYSGIEESYNYPRQKLPLAYIQNGAFDIIWSRTIIEKKSMTGNLILPYVMEDKYSVNIDTHIDFELAELLIKRM